MTRLFFVTSGVSLLCLCILLMNPGPGALALQLVPVGLTILTIRNWPRELRRSLYRNLRAELLLDAIAMISLLSLFIAQGVVPAAFRSVAVRSVFLLAYAVLGLMIVRIIHFVTVGVGRAKRS